VTRLVTARSTSTGHECTSSRSTRPYHTSGPFLRYNYVQLCTVLVPVSKCTSTNARTRTRTLVRVHGRVNPANNGYSGSLRVGPWGMERIPVLVERGSFPLNLMLSLSVADSQWLWSPRHPRPHLRTSIRTAALPHCRTVARPHGWFLATQVYRRTGLPHT
jgi:hypothetical protein